MRVRSWVWRLSSEPPDSAVVAFFDVNESAGVSNGLKCLKAFHGITSMCLFQHLLGDDRHGLRKAVFIN
jgi:hypothetical protein